MAIDCAVILAGGKGTRLRPLTSNKPKPLLPVTLTPMIDFTIKQIRDAGIKKIIVAVKYLGEQIRDYLTTSPHYDDLEITISDTDSIGTADAVRKIADSINGDFIVSMADIVCNLKVKDIIKFYKRTDSYASISLKNVNFPTKKFGVIILDKNQNIEIFLEKPRPEEMLFTTLAFAYRSVSEFHQNLVNTGLYIFKNKVLEILDSFNDINDFGQELFPYLLQEKFKLTGFVDEYYWIDCGNIRSYLWANWDMLRGFVDGIYPPGNFDKGSWFGKNLQKSEDVRIISPVVIGDNVILENGATIGPYSVLHNDVAIQEKCRIDHSVVWEKSNIGKFSHVHNSVICNNVNVEDNRTIINFSAIS